jgi:hypothetical protein
MRSLTRPTSPSLRDIAKPAGWLGPRHRRYDRVYYVTAKPVLHAPGRAPDRGEQWRKTPNVDLYKYLTTPVENAFCGGPKPDRQASP